MLSPCAIAVPQGVVTHSSGNHGQAVALAARLNGVTAHVVVPRTTPQCKVDAIQGYGGAALLYWGLAGFPHDPSELQNTSTGCPDDTQHGRRCCVVPSSCVE